MNDTVIRVTEDDKPKYKEFLSKVGDGKIGRELLCLLKSKYRNIYIRSQEEQRVISVIKTISILEGYDFVLWDLARGLVDGDTLDKVSSDNNEVHSEPEALLNYVIDCCTTSPKFSKSTSGLIFVLLDFHYFLHELPTIERKLKLFASLNSICHIIVVSPEFICPPTLEKEFTLLDFPYPSSFEIQETLDNIIESIPAKHKKVIESSKAKYNECVNAARGLTLIESENAFAKSIVKKGMIDVDTILEEKRQTIKKSGILEYCESKFTFDQIGGLDCLKQWFKVRKLAFTKEAIDYGISTPRGVLLVGVPGNGKSMICAALSDLYQMPLLRLDMGSIFGAHVGQSEKNIRDVIKQAEAISPCVLWLDEIDKGIAKSDNISDGGTTTRVLATLLTWMQEKEQPVFLVFTANGTASIPPEFMRAGRIDEVFFVDLPSFEQRKEVIQCLLKRKNRNPANFNLDDISYATDTYSPAEIEKAINNAMFVAFGDNVREMRTEDIVEEAKKFQPLYNSKREEIIDMRIWALGENGSGGRARLASSR